MQSELSEKQITGQHLVAGLSSPTLGSRFKQMVRDHKVGNVFLESPAIVEATQVRRLCDDIRALIESETGVQPLILTSQEAVDRSSFSLAVRMPSAMAIAATGDAGNAYTAARVTAAELRTFGIDILFTTSLEILSNRMLPGVARRTFSDNPMTVATFGSSMLRGIQDGHLLGGAMYFPGLGHSWEEASQHQVTIGKNTEELAECELAPYATAINGALDAVMISPAGYPGLESEPIPATCSYRVITKLLREQLGYDRLVCSAQLDIPSISSRYDIGRAAVASLRSGADLVYIGQDQEHIADAARAVLLSVDGEWGTDDRQRSLLRIRNAKDRLGALKPEHRSIPVDEEYRQVTRAIMDRAITIGHLPEDRLAPLGEHPLFIGCKTYTQEKPSFANWMAKAFGGAALEASADPDTEEMIRLLQQIDGKSSVVMATCDGHIRQGQLALANSMAGTGLTTYVFALCSPYDLIYLAENIHSFAVYDDTPLAFDAIKCILEGQRSATGSLPVRC